MERDVQYLAELESLNSGKGVRMAREFDIGDAIACLRYYAGWAGKVTGETIELGPTKQAYTILDPIGVCGQVRFFFFSFLSFVSFRSFDVLRVPLRADNALELP